MNKFILWVKLSIEGKETVYLSLLLSYNKLFAIIAHLVLFLYTSFASYSSFSFFKSFWGNFLLSFFSFSKYALKSN